MAPSFTWNSARRETRVIDSTRNRVSAQRGIAMVQLVCFLTLLTLFAQKCLSGAFKSQSKRRSAAIVRHHVIAALLHNSKKEHQLARKLHATCIVRIADISFM
jgi:hypothetical protein